jgi:hypothetical protein
MTIQEAIKSGKPLYRKCWGNNRICIEVEASNFIVWELTQEPMSFKKGDILAEDWEIKE